MLVAVFLVLIGVNFALGRECCHTGYATYTWCTNYCCDLISSSAYYQCCSYSFYHSYSSSSWRCSSSSSSSGSTYNSGSYSYNYDSYSTDDVLPVWIYVIIGLGSFGGLVVTIVCCVCCVKGCTANNRRTGAMVVNPAQQGQGAFIINNATSQQTQPPPQQPHYMYGPGPQPGQLVYPPSYPGPSNMGPKQPTSLINTDVEKGDAPST